MSDKPFHNPFESLAGQFGHTPGERPAPAPAAPPTPHIKAVPRAVVRLERAGRGGKEVTVVEHLDLGPLERTQWLKALKGALGCGGVVEGNALVLQGDQRDRLPPLLEGRGVRKVTVAR